VRVLVRERARGWGRSGEIVGEGETAINERARSSVGGVVGERIGERERGCVRIINGGERRREWEEKLMWGDGQDGIFCGWDFVVFGVANQIFIHFWFINFRKFEYFVIVNHLSLC
jgi:hypothetical protein